MMVEADGAEEFSDGNPQRFCNLSQCIIADEAITILIGSRTGSRGASTSRKSFARFFCSTSMRG